MPKGSLKKFATHFAGGRPPDLCIVAVNGAAANTDISVSGVVGGVSRPINVNDQLASVLQIADAAPVIARDVTAQATITSSGHLRVSVDTTGQQLLVYYWSV